MADYMYKRKTDDPKKAQMTKYTVDIAEKAYKLSLLGMTDKEMIEFFGIAEQTWYNWQNRFPSLREAIQKGKIEADSNVAYANYKRAIGYEYEEEVAHVIDEKVVKTKLQKHMAPNPTAFIFWLKNRTGRKSNLQEFSWQDVNKTEVTGRDGGPIKTQNRNIDTEIDLSDLTDEELKMLESIGMKTLQKEGPD
jgi:hypothetical protein